MAGHPFFATAAAFYCRKIIKEQVIRCNYQAVHMVFRRAHFLFFVSMAAFGDKKGTKRFSPGEIKPTAQAGLEILLWR